MTGNLFESGAAAAGMGGAAKAGASEWLTAHCDGGSRGNPGPAGYGAVITDGGGQVVARLSEFLGIQTNNYAEYSGLLAVLKWALEHGRRKVRVVSDSELMVKQMKGQYKVASPGLRPLWEEAKGLARKLDGFEMSHTLRGGNKEADRLANEAMDRGMGKTMEQGPGNRAQKGSGVSGAGEARANAYERPPRAPQASQNAPKQARQVIEGYVKDGVVHLLEGELPDGIFVKVVRE
ncbi:ribonuclease HI family protein [Occallatibacter riparius]|uniref:Ribonuclease HI family protein n=1 Tax=Occallatibacter riparius TaxID=1002689 RepID=A0A9J7BRG9_9BACT|nr:ribonuclease HI family protein [Occallatibacter riparius]UWZ85476.1 ribonuclease HI family protein [Occallatibacter riparius]